MRLNNKRIMRKFRLSFSEDVVLGRHGEIVDDDDSYGPVLAVKFIAVPRNAVMTGALRNRHRQALAAGLRLKVKHGDESTFHFDPSNVAEAELAIRLVGAGHKRPSRPATQRPSDPGASSDAPECRSLSALPHDSYGPVLAVKFIAVPRNAVMSSAVGKSPDGR